MVLIDVPSASSKCGATRALSLAGVGITVCGLVAVAAFGPAPPRSLFLRLPHLGEESPALLKQQERLTEGGCDDTEISISGSDGRTAKGAGCYDSANADPPDSWGTCGALPQKMQAVLAAGPSPGGLEDEWNLYWTPDAPLPPCPYDDEVQVMVAGSSVNPADWYEARTRGGAQQFAADPGLGNDLSGIVVAVGRGCASKLSIGDEVWGVTSSAQGDFRRRQQNGYAQFANTYCKLVTKVPREGAAAASLNLADLGTMGLAGSTSMTAMRDAGAPWAPSDNVTVVVTSGAGGTGVYAIQEALGLGAARGASRRAAASLCSPTCALPSCLSLTTPSHATIAPSMCHTQRVTSHPPTHARLAPPPAAQWSRPRLPTTPTSCSRSAPRWCSTTTRRRSGTCSPPTRCTSMVKWPSWEAIAGQHQLIRLLPMPWCALPRRHLRCVWLYRCTDCTRRRSAGRCRMVKVAVLVAPSLATTGLSDLGLASEGLGLAF